MIRRMRCAACLLVCAFLMGGCYNYSDMNRLLFSTLAIFHRDQDGKIVVLGEFFKAYRGEGEKAGMEKRIVLQGRGETVFEAISWIRLATSFPMEYAENKALVLSMDLIKGGVKEVLDSTDRDQKPSWRQYMFAFEGKPEELMNLKMEDEQFNGLFLYNMMIAQEKNISTTELQFYEMIDNLNMGSQINLIPILKIETHNAKQENSGESGDKKGDSQKETDDPEGGQQDTSQSKGGTEDSGASKTGKEEIRGQSSEQSDSESGGQNSEQSDSESGGQSNKQSGGQSNKQSDSESGGQSENQSPDKSSDSSGGSGSNTNQLITPHFLLDGAVVLVGNSLAASITKPQLEAYNFFKVNIGEGILITNNPEYEGKQASFAILSSKPKATIKYENERIKLNYRIKIKLVLMEAEEGITLSDHTIEEKLIGNAKATIEKRMMDFYKEMKEKKIDILDIKRLLYIKYPALVIDDPLSITELSVETAITLDDEGKIRDARY